MLLTCQEASSNKQMQLPIRTLSPISPSHTTAQKPLSNNHSRTRILMRKVPINRKSKDQSKISKHWLQNRQWTPQARLRRWLTPCSPTMETVQHSSYAMKTNSSSSRISLTTSMRRISTSSWWALPPPTINKTRASLQIALAPTCSSWLHLHSHPIMRPTKAKRKISSQLQDSHIPATHKVPLLM